MILATIFLSIPQSPFLLLKALKLTVCHVCRRPSTSTAAHRWRWGTGRGPPSTTAVGMSTDGEVVAAAREQNSGGQKSHLDGSRRPGVGGRWWPRPRCAHDGDGLMAPHAGLSPAVLCPSSLVLVLVRGRTTYPWRDPHIPFQIRPHPSFIFTCLFLLWIDCAPLIQSGISSHLISASTSRCYLSILIVGTWTTVFITVQSLSLWLMQKANGTACSV